MSKVTTDFAIEYLLDDCDDCPEKADDNECISQSHCFEVKRMAIQALKQMDALDKIRAEIMELDYDDYDRYEGANISPMVCRDLVIEIIDKYRKEQTEK